jgi:hypothetical protein
MGLALILPEQAWTELCATCRRVGCGRPGRRSSAAWKNWPVGPVPGWRADADSRQDPDDAPLDEATHDADLIIEAVYEDRELKREVFRQLDALCPELTILTSNTSSYPSRLLAQATGRLDRVVGSYFFYPPSRAAGEDHAGGTHVC